MASHTSPIDENIEIKLLLNFCMNKVLDLPHNVYGILNSQDEDTINNEHDTRSNEQDTINNELSIFIEAVRKGDSLGDIVHNSLSETHAHLSWLCTGVASLLYFVQCNWTDL